MDASADAHQGRLRRSVAAIREYLMTHFPGHIVEDKRDIECHRWTFALEKGNDRRLLRVEDEVLDLDAEEVIRRLVRLQVAHRLRDDVRDAQALLVSEEGTQIAATLTVTPKPAPPNPPGARGSQAGITTGLAGSRDVAPKVFGASQMRCPDHRKHPEVNNLRMGDSKWLVDVRACCEPFLKQIEAALAS